MIAGGRKAKEEPSTAVGNKPQVSNGAAPKHENTVDLGKAGKSGGKERKKKSCC